MAGMVEQQIHRDPALLYETHVRRTSPPGRYANDREIAIGSCYPSQWS
jgi:hypothetical protein